MTQPPLMPVYTVNCQNTDASKIHIFLKTRTFGSWSLNTERVTCVITEYSRTVLRCFCSDTNVHSNHLKTKIDLLYAKLSPYRAVNTLRLGYKNQSVNAI